MALPVKDGTLPVWSLPGTPDELSLSFVDDCTITGLPFGRRVVLAVEFFSEVLVVLSLSGIETSWMPVPDGLETVIVFSLPDSVVVLSLSETKVAVLFDP